MVWPILLGLLGGAGGAGAAAGGAAVTGGGGGMLSGLLSGGGGGGGMLSGLMSKDGMENAASQPGEPGMAHPAVQAPQGGVGQDVSRDGMMPPAALIELARRVQQPAERQLLPTTLMGLLGG